jgi:tetratricopeptide (TPR) repeat protein
LSRLRQRQRLRSRVWTALLVVLSPLAFVTVAELGLRAVGFGYAPTLFRPVSGADAYTTNLDFAYRFFSRDIAIRPVPLYFAAEKPEDGYRVFVVGGSAAFGDFMPEYGLARILEVLLEERYPGVAFEVVNAAVAAVNSHVVLPIVREVARHDPDLIVFYIGNNEVVGPYGPGSVRIRTGTAGETPGRLRVRAGLWVRGLRLGQLIERALIALGIGGSGEAPEALAAGDLTRALVRFDDPRLPPTYAHFKRNLQDMLRAATASGGKALVVTVASNLRNFSPFASLHRRDLGDEETAAFDTAYAEGFARQGRGDCEGALAAYARAAAIDEEFAVLDFQRGTCLLRLGRIDEAREALVRARELDAGRYRADSAINAILRETEADGVRLLDGEARFAESGLAPVPIPGDEFFYDHVHLRFDGSALLAHAVFEAVEPMLPAWIRSRATGSPASVSAVAEALALTPFDRERLARLIAARRAKLGAEPEGEGAEVALASAFWRNGEPFWSDGEEPGLAGDSVVLYRRAIERRPADLLLRRNFATLLLAEGDPAAAAEQLRVLVERVPDIAEWRLAYGTALRLDGSFEEALRQLETAVSLDPADFQAELQLAGALRELDRSDEAIDHYERVLLARPENLASHFQLGTLRLERGELDAAVSHFEAVLQGAPGNAEAHNALGVAFFNQGKLQRSVAHLRKALQHDPQNATARENLQAVLQGFRGQGGRTGGR